MRFWDSSAIVPLLVQEPMSETVGMWLIDDGEVALWGLTRVELVSAVERRSREGHLSRDARRLALSKSERFVASASEVSDLVVVRKAALSLLARHPLRAADALQLAAALLVADGEPATLGFVTFDARLADAADREGLVVWTSPGA